MILTVRRTKKLMGFAISFPIYVDGECIGELKNGKCLNCNVEDGVHSVVFKCLEKELETKVEVDSRNVEIICHAKLGLLAAVVSIDKVIYR